MPDRSLSRQSILDPAVADLLTSMEQKQSLSQLTRKQRIKKNREHEKITARKEQRVTYDLPPAIRTWIKEIAEEHAVPASQIVTLALARFMNEFNQGNIDLGIYKQPSRSPRYEWNLVFPDSLVPEKEKKAK